MSSKKSDEILNELFTTFKEKKMRTVLGDTDDSEDENEIKTEKSDQDSDDSRRERKKKKKKHKKKKKKHKKSDGSSSDSDDKENDDNDFWGGVDPYDEKENGSSENKHSRRHADQDTSRRERTEYDRENGGRRRRSRDRSDEDRRRRRSRERSDDDRRRRSRDRADAGARRNRDSSGDRRDKTRRRSRSRDRRSRSRDRRSRSRDRRSRSRGRRSKSREKRRPYEREDEKRGRDRHSQEKRAKDDFQKEKDDKEADEEAEDAGGGGDGFWDTKWDAMKLEERIEKGEKRGMYYLNTKKRFKDATGNKEGTPSLSPSPERKKKKHDTDSEEETEEFKRLKKLRDMANLKVDGDGLVSGPVADANNYEYDKKTRMYRKKEGMVELEQRRMEGGDKDKEKESSSSDKDDDGDDKDDEKKSDDDAKKVKGKKEKDIKEDKVSSGEDKEDGELDSEEEKRRKKDVTKEKSRRRRSYSRSDRNERDRYSRENYSRERDSRSARDSHRRSSRRSSRSRSRTRRRSRSPYDRSLRSRYSRSRSPRGSRRDGSMDPAAAARDYEDRYERNKRRQERHLRSKINKERLLDIAKKNAAKILKSGGDLMGMDQDRLIAMKSGGQSLDELTKFCKELARKGLEDKEKIDFLAESESESEEEDENDEKEDYRHPFLVRDRPLPNPITMLLGMGSEKQESLPPAAKAVAKSQRMLEFPVSSGTAHREKVEVTGESLTGPEQRLAIEMKTEEEEMLRFHEQMQAEEEKLSKIGTEIKPWSLNDDDKNITEANPLGRSMFNTEMPELSEAELESINKLKPKPVTAPAGAADTDEKPAATATAADDKKPEEGETSRLALPAPTDPIAPAQPKLSSDPDKVFDTTAAPVVDIGTIVSKWLNARRKQQANPQDPIALKDMYDAQKQMDQWALSKNKPGQFLGSTGAKVMAKHEITNNSMQVWARQDQFTRAQKVRGGFGEFMLKKLGWKEGEGIGRFKQGDVNPLTLDIKYDKKGLTAAEEEKHRGGSSSGGVVTLTGCKDLSGKHPVSALTELCSKRRWGPPIFSQAFEVGPPHKKQFVFKVEVNGKGYMASVAVDNKKKAKANAAMACLIDMGLVPRDPDNPV